MKQRLRGGDFHYLEYLYCHLLLVFLVGRVAFVTYNHGLARFSLLDALGACWDGLWMHDLFLTALLLLVPWLATLLSVRRDVPLRALLAPYYVVMGLAVGIIVGVDIIMYEFWQFKLNAVILTYASYPEGAANSVSPSFIALRVSAILVYALCIIVPCIWLTPKRMERTGEARGWVRTLSLIWCIMLWVSVAYMQLGDAYSPRRTIFLNHAATNSVYAFASSFHVGEDYAHRYGYLSEDERATTFRGLYPSADEGTDIIDTLLRTRRPDVLIVLIESLSGKFVSELGGLPDVTPQWSRLIPEGIFWENYYSNSFRTDRGTVSTYSGVVSLPDVAVMPDTARHRFMPSLARTMREAGYETSYLYSSQMTNMGKRAYLENMGFQTLYDHTAFRSEELDGPWGANDLTSAMMACRLIARKDTTQRWMMAYQTLSSHEPWEVPYQRLADERLNAFAFTDHCIGQMVDSLKALPQWENMLVILLPDHGYLYDQNYEDPEFFHSPMLWLGGAIREPRRMEVLMNQSDLCATLLGQLGIGHEAFPWSRNVLSRSYTYPFVYCNFPAGIMLRDSTGVSIFDITASRLLMQSPPDQGERIRKAQAILQTSYLEL